MTYKLFVESRKMFFEISWSEYNIRVLSRIKPKWRKKILRIFCTLNLQIRPEDMDAEKNF
jgi:hypothetical protein